MRAKKHAVVTAVVLALLPFLLAGCPKKSGDPSDASADEAGPQTTAAATASDAPSASATAVHAATSCKPGESLMKVKGAHGTESQCHRPCAGDRECTAPRGFCFGQTVDGKGYCQSLKESQPKCKPGEKVVQVAAVMFECWAGVCKTDADCKAPSKCVTGQDGWDPDNAATHYHPCSVPDVPAAPSASATATASASGGLVVPPGSPFSFPNPKHLKCPVPYFLSDDTCQMSSRPGQ